MINKQNHHIWQDAEIFQELLNILKGLLKNKKYNKAEKLLQEIIKDVRTSAEADLLIAEKKRKKALWHFRIAILSIFTLTVCTIAILALRKVNSTEVTIDLQLDGMTFTTNEYIDIFGMPVKDIKISHLDTLTLNPDFVEKGNTNQNNKNTITWSNTLIKGPTSIKPLSDYWNISVESEYMAANIRIDSGSTVKLTLNELNSNLLRLEIVKGYASGSIDLDRQFILTCNQCRVQNRYESRRSTGSYIFRIYSDEQELRFNSLDENLNLYFEFNPNDKTSGPNIQLRNIDIANIVLSRLSGKDIESTIIDDGTIYYAELDGESTQIREGDYLNLNTLNNFQIKQLSVKKNIELSLLGRVDNIKSGSEKYRYSRMPSLLEWIYKNQLLKLIIGSLIPVFTTILAILFRLRLIPEIKK